MATGVGVATGLRVATGGHRDGECEPPQLYAPRLTPNDTHAKKRPADRPVHEPFNHTNQAMPQHRPQETDHGQITTWPGSRRTTSDQPS